MYQQLQVKHERLLVISILGLIVNLIGIYAFQHGHSHNGNHHHSHNSNNQHSHSHSHLHENIENAGTKFMSGNTQIMQGVFLHILADTLGSVGVIISAILMHLFGWMIADPICSLFIAILIALSVLPLIKNSAMILMQRQPVALDRLLPQCYQKVNGLAGVFSVQDPHFWTLCSDVYIGAIKLEVSKNIDSKYVLKHTKMIFESVGIRQVHIQLDYVSSEP